MLIVNKTLIDKEIIDNYFSCNLIACKGNCCVEGNAGAPLEKKEVKEIKKNFPFVKKYLSNKSIEEIQKKRIFCNRRRW